MKLLLDIANSDIYAQVSLIMEARLPVGYRLVFVSRSDVKQISDRSAPRPHPGGPEGLGLAS